MKYDTPELMMQAVDEECRDEVVVMLGGEVALQQKKVPTINESMLKSPT